MGDVIAVADTRIQKLHSERKEGFVGAQGLPDLKEFGIPGGIGPQSTA